MFAMNACLKDVPESSNNEFPIKLEKVNGSINIFNWTKLNVFGFKYYLITKTDSPSEIYKDIKEIPSSEIFKKILDKDINFFNDSSNIKSSYYRVYTLVNDKLYASNEIYWASNFLNLSSSNSYFVDLKFDENNKNLIIKTNLGIQIFDPINKVVKLNRSYNFSSGSLELQDLVIGDLGRGHEIIVFDNNNIIFLDPLTLVQKDTIRLNNYTNGILITKDSLLFAIGYSQIETINRLTKKVIATNNLILNPDKVSITSTDDIIVGNSYDGFSFYKINRNNGKISLISSGFKGDIPNNFSNVNINLSDDGEYFFSANSSLFFSYDKFKKLVFSKKMEFQTQISDMQVSPNKMVFVQIVSKFNSKKELHIYDFENMNLEKKVVTPNLSNISYMYVTDDYIFLLGNLINPSTGFSEFYMETIEI